MTRVAFYSHDSQGLGHVRRNLALAAAMRTEDDGLQTLVLAGAAESAALPRPAGCDVVGLPSLTKDADGSYGARHLDVPLPDLLAIRCAVLAAALHAFAPDVLVVDRHPRGFAGELETALDGLDGRTRVVLGLRDVLDEPGVAGREWARDEGAAALDRWYDEVWVYGDRHVFDCTAALGLSPHQRHRVTFTGYLAAISDHDGAGRGDRAASSILCLVGGGGDGRNLADAFIRASWPGRTGVLVLGPQMPDADRVAIHSESSRGGRSDLRVVDFVPQMAPLLAEAGAAVTMGGYNSVCELLGHGVPSLVVPRVRPRSEQLVRARRLAALGLLDVLHPAALSPRTLTDWLDRQHGAARPDAAGRVDLAGLRTVPRLLRRLTTATATATRELADVAV